MATRAQCARHENVREQAEHRFLDEDLDLLANRRVDAHRNLSSSFSQMHAVFYVRFPDRVGAAVVGSARTHVRPFVRSGEHTPSPCAMGTVSRAYVQRLHAVWRAHALPVRGGFSRGGPRAFPERRARSLVRTRGARTRRDSARCSRAWRLCSICGALARRGAQATSEGRERDLDAEGLKSVAYPNVRALRADQSSTRDNSWSGRNVDQIAPSRDGIPESRKARRPLSGSHT